MRAQKKKIDATQETQKNKDLKTKNRENVKCRKHKQSQNSLWHFMSIKIINKGNQRVKIIPLNKSGFKGRGFLGRRKSASRMRNVWEMLK